MPHFYIKENSRRITEVKKNVNDLEYKTIILVI